MKLPTYQQIAKHYISLFRSWTNLSSCPHYQNKSQLKLFTTMDDKDQILQSYWPWWLVGHVHPFYVPSPGEQWPSVLQVWHPDSPAIKAIISPVAITSNAVQNWTTELNFSEFYSLIILCSTPHSEWALNILTISQMGDRPTPHSTIPISEFLSAPKLYPMVVRFIVCLQDRMRRQKSYRYSDYWKKMHWNSSIHSINVTKLLCKSWDSVSAGDWVTTEQNAAQH